MSPNGHTSAMIHIYPAQMIGISTSVYRCASCGAAMKEYQYVAKTQDMLPASLFPASLFGCSSCSLHLQGRELYQALNDGRVVHVMENPRLPL